MKAALLRIALTFGLAIIALPGIAADGPGKLLVVTTTAAFRHTSIPTAEKVLAQLAAENRSFTIEYVRQPAGKPVPPKKPAAPRPEATPDEQAAFKAAQEKYAAAQAAFEAADQRWQQELKKALAKLSPESLKQYDGIVFANTSGELPIPDKPGMLEWLRSGKAFIGVHSASDTFHGWPEYLEMLGGEFNTHGAQVCVECLNENPAHPANAAFGPTWRIPQEEIYLFNRYDPAKVSELLVLDKHPNNGTPGRYPVSWCRQYGKGRVFYTSLGHREDIWDADPNIPDRKNPVAVSKAYQAHLLGGIRWALGR